MWIVTRYRYSSCMRSTTYRSKNEYRQRLNKIEEQCRPVFGLTSHARKKESFDRAELTREKETSTFTRPDAGGFETGPALGPEGPDPATGEPVSYGPVRRDRMIGDGDSLLGKQFPTWRIDWSRIRGAFAFWVIHNDVQRVPLLPQRQLMRFFYELGNDLNDDSIEGQRDELGLENANNWELYVYLIYFRKL